MSIDINTIIRAISDAAPITFVIASLAGAIGSFASTWYTSRLVSRIEINEIERIAKEIAAARTPARQVEELAALQREILAVMAGAGKEQREAKVSPIALGVAKLAEYVGNHSQTDRLIRRVAP